MSDPELINFFQQAQKSLLSSATGRARENGVIIVKENVCFDDEDGGPCAVFDEEDSSVTRLIISSLLSNTH
jgi:protein N-terminal methyltransferase